MSMTREEAINRIKDHMAAHHIGEYPHIKLKEALDMALSALRPVSREQVEKLWRGEWVEETYSTKSERNRTIHSKKCICSVCNKSNGRKKENFCPACGTPMTDEAVEMVMERMEALKDGSTSD